MYTERLREEPAKRSVERDLLGESTKIKQPLFVLSGQGKGKATNIWGFISFVKNGWERGLRGTFPDRIFFFNLSISRRAWELWCQRQQTLETSHQTYKSDFLSNWPLCLSRWRQKQGAAWRSERQPTEALESPWSCSLEATLVLGIVLFLGKWGHWARELGDCAVVSLHLILQTLSGCRWRVVRLC